MVSGEEDMGHGVTRLRATFREAKTQNLLVERGLACATQMKLLAESGRAPNDGPLAVALGLQSHDVRLLFRDLPVLRALRNRYMRDYMHKYKQRAA